MAKAEKQEKTKKRKEKPTMDQAETPATDEEEKSTTLQKNKKKKKKKKKLKKDKWGQPLSSAAEAEEEAPMEMSLEMPATKRQRQMQGEETCYETKKVVVSGMPYSTTEDEIRDFFEGVGDITQMQLTTFPDTGNFRGLAFLTFKTAVSATKSLELDGREMGGRSIKVERCRQDPSKKRKVEFLEEPKKDGYNSAYIGNLAWDVTEDDIRGLLAQSNIDSIRLTVNKKTGKFRGFGHIDFVDDESLEQAISKNQAELHGRSVRIAYAIRNK